MPYLRDQWYAAALAADVGAEPFARTICGEDIVFFRTADGRIAALEDRCAHRHAPLSLGDVVDGSLQCGYHGLRFDGNGRCVRIPGQKTIPPTACVRAYPAAERDGWIWIWIGTPERADPQRIPPLPYFNGGDWAGFQKYFHVAAAAQLFVDNLMDLSHVAFTHKASIGSSAGAEAPSDLEVGTEGDVVRGRRRVFDVDPGPFVARWGDFPGTIDRDSRYVWRPPSVVEITARFSDAERAITIMVINPITPETETTAHFWIGWARDFALGDAEQTARAVEENTQVILEDVRIIEAQQRVMDKNPGAPVVPIQADKGVIAVQRVIDRLRRAAPLSSEDKAVSRHA